MKILYLASVRIPSEKASGLAIVRQCQAFVDTGHTLDLLVPKRSSAENLSIEDVYGIKPNFNIKQIKSFSLFSLGRIGFYFMLLTEAFKMFFYYWGNKEKYDVVYSRDHRMLIPFVLSGLANKCFLELHTNHTDFVTKFISKRVKRLIVISSGLAESYESMTGRTDIQVEPSGVDLEQFFGLPSVEVLRDALSLPKEKIILGYVGKYKTMGESKGVDEIIIAFSKAFQKNKNIHLLLVGIEENEKTEVINLIKNAGVHEGVYTVMPLDQKRFAEYLMASDVLLMNYPDTEHYRKYMSPTKLFAYIASGKIIISSDLLSVREIANESLVVFVSPGNVSNLEEKISEVCINIDYYKSSKKNTRHSVLKYVWNKRAERIGEYFNQ